MRPDSKLDQAAIEDKILEILKDRGTEGSASPNEIGQALSGNPNDGAAWRKLLRNIRESALSLADRELIVAKRKGKAVDLRTAKGVVRYAIAPEGAP